MAIPINKQGGRATYYYPGDGYLRRYDDFGVTQISLEVFRIAITYVVEKGKPLVSPA